MISENLLYERPREWVHAVLARGHQQRMAARGTYYDWLLDEYLRRATDPFGEAVRTGLVSLLERPPLGAGHDGGVLSLALALVAQGRVEAAGDVLLRLVQARTLTEPMGSYADLHGRALEALNALGRLEHAAAWSEELERDEGYAPLVFSFIRDTTPYNVPDFLDIARAGFLRQALHSIVVELGIIRESGPGFQLLMSAARRIGDAGHEDYVQEFVEAFPLLHLNPVMRFRLWRALDPRCSWVRVVVAGHTWPLAEPLRAALVREGVAVSQTLDAGPEVLLVVDGASLNEVRIPRDELARYGAVLAVFDERGPRRAVGGVPVRSIRVPLRVPGTAASRVRDNVLQLLPQLARRLNRSRSLLGDSTERGRRRANHAGAPTAQRRIETVVAQAARGGEKAVRAITGAVRRQGR